MLTKFMADGMLFVLDALVAGIDVLLPAQFLEWLELFATQAGSMLSFGPVAAIGLLFAVGWTIDMAFNALAFIVQTYKLIPAKAT